MENNAPKYCEDVNRYIQFNNKKDNEILVQENKAVTTYLNDTKVLVFAHNYEKGVIDDLEGKLYCMRIFCYIKPFEREKDERRFYQAVYNNPPNMADLSQIFIRNKNCILSSIYTKNLNEAFNSCIEMQEILRTWSAIYPNIPKPYVPKK